MKLRIRLAATCLLLGACALPGSPVEGQADLGLAQQAVEEGDLGSAERALGGLFLDGRDPRRDSEVFWAGWLLAQAHADLALGPGAPGPSAVGAHIQAALRYARLARESLLAAPVTPPAGITFAGTREQAALGLDLLEVSLVARLGFDERVARLVDANFALSKPEGAQGLVREAALEGPRAAYLWLALFDYWSSRDVPAAFELAARVLEVSDATPGMLESREITRVEQWIRTGAGKTFRCPECRQPAVPELRACPNDQTPLARFYVAPRG